MKIVFDLDYTLLDTVAFKKALVGATGVDAKAWQDAYDASVKANKGLFEPGAFFGELTRRGLFGEHAAAQARARFDAVLERTEDFLYPEARELLEALAAHDVTVDLMTFGEANWQKAKVERSGLTEMFDDVLYAEKDKKEFIRGLGEGHDKVIVVNDNGKEMEEMMAVAPEHAYILKKGPKPVPESLRLPTAHDMGEVAALLEKETGWELRREMREMREADETAEPKVVPPEGEIRGSIDVGDGDGTEEARRDANRPSARL